MAGVGTRIITHYGMEINRNSRCLGQAGEFGRKLRRKFDLGNYDSNYSNHEILPYPPSELLDRSADSPLAVVTGGVEAERLDAKSYRALVVQLKRGLLSRD